MITLLVGLRSLKSLDKVNQQLEEELMKIFFQHLFIQFQGLGVKFKRYEIEQVINGTWKYEG